MASSDGTHHRARRFRTRIASGLVVLIPLVVTVFILRSLFTLTAGILLPVIDPAVEDWPWLWRAGLSISVLVAGVYVLGEIATHVVGRRVLEMGEGVVLRLPFVKVIYSASKQVAAAFQGSHSRAFKSVVFVEFPRSGMRAVGFLTSTFVEADGSKWSSVFVPTTPNPTTGFLQILPDEEVTRTSFSVEEGVKMIMSLGALVPEMVNADRAASRPRRE